MADEPETGAPGTIDPGALAVDDENAALIAELDAAAAKPAKPAKKPTPAPEAEAEDDADEPAEPAEDDSDEEADAEPEDDEDEDDEDPEPDEPDDESEKDPALKKRLDAVRRTEERRRQQLEQERAGFDRERATWQNETKQHRDAVARITTLAARAKIDPASVLEALGLTPDDMEYAGQQCYARGKTAAADPKYRQAAERAAREREVTDQAAANAKRIADLEAKLEATETQTAVERELDAYFDKAFRKATDATPITARLIAKRPKAARAELAATAVKLAEQLGRMPKPAELLAAHEKREVRALRLRGIEPPTPGAGKPAAAPAAAAKPIGKPAGKKPTARAAEVEAVDPDEIVIPSTADLVKELQAARRN